MAKSAKSIELSIRRLQKEIAEIDSYFYMSNQTGHRFLYEGMLERKRDDLVRGAVLQLHTAIEDLINALLLCSTLGVQPEKRFKARGTRAKAMHRLLSGGGSLGFDAKLSLAVALGMIRAPVRTKLAELNSMRNKCSHNWLLGVSVRRGKRRDQKNRLYCFSEVRTCTKWLSSRSSHPNLGCSTRSYLGSCIRAVTPQSE